MTNTPHNLKVVGINPNQTVHTHGVREQKKVASAADLHLEEIRRVGFVVLPGAINETDTVYFRNAIDLGYAQQIEELGGESIAENLSDANNIRCPLSLDDRFLELAAHPAVCGIMDAILGENYVLLMQNAIINKPEKQQYQTYWHRDLNYQHWTSSRPVIMNALFCIDDFTMENGCTVALPGSHLHEDFPSNEFVLKHEIPITAKAGDVIVMDSMVYHRAGYNLSNHSRRAVNNVIGLPFMVQQIDMPSVLGDKYAQDPFLSKYLGYRWSPATSAKSWRMARLPKR